VTYDLNYDPLDLEVEDVNNGLIFDFGYFIIRLRFGFAFKFLNSKCEVRTRLLLIFCVLYLCSGFCNLIDF